MSSHTKNLSLTIHAQNGLDQALQIINGSSSLPPRLMENTDTDMIKKLTTNLSTQLKIYHYQIYRMMVLHDGQEPCQLNAKLKTM